MHSEGYRYSTHYIMIQDFTQYSRIQILHTLQNRHLYYKIGLMILILQTEGYKYSKLYRRILILQTQELL